MHKILSTVVVAGALAFPGLALADLSANLGLTTNYKYRGQDQSSNKPAVSAGFDWSSGGLYLGNWNSSIGFTDAGIEMDFYGGYKTEVGGVGLDFGFLRYQYPQKVSIGDLNTTELYVGASYGMFGAKYSRTISSKYFGIADGKGTGYLALTGDVPLGKTLVLNASYGTTRFSGGAKKAGAVNYDDYKLGVTADLGSGFKASVAYVGATEKDAWGDINKARVIVSLTKSM